MPAGCDFVCENENCEYYKLKIQISGTWPIAKIDKVIESKKIRGTSYEENLRKLKKDGKEYACVVFPNKDVLFFDGAKIERFCSKCLKRITSFLMFPYSIGHKKFDRVFTREFKKSGLKSKCGDCGSKIFDLQKMIKKGIKCPKCGVETKQYRWFC